MKKQIMSQEALQSMLSHDLMLYTSDVTLDDNRPNTLGCALALYSLVLNEHENAEGGEVADRAVEHLISVTSAEKAPSFDAICLWSYCVLTASIALAKATPTLWEKIPADVKLRLDFMMEVYSYLECFATSDENSYSTGPGLGGNFHKNWNPNYRLANVPVMIFAASYFGDGDMELGTKRVNALLHGFNEEVYDRVIATFDQFGWHRAKATWTTPARMHEDGTYGTDARHVLLWGGETYALDYTHSYVKKDVGNGLGVTNGGKDYTYYTFPLTDSPSIVEHLLRYNYSGGEVKSDHHYDVNGDGVAERIAWIVDGTTSPYQGRMGMMKEFASGNRSSTGYCAHDFVLTTCLISAVKALGIYDARSNAELWEMIKVGNGDFLYKNERGYQCFSTGSYGTSAKAHSEENEGPPYFAMKSLWLTSMKD